MDKRACPECYGDGVVHIEEQYIAVFCPRCRGKGYIEEEKVGEDKGWQEFADWVQSSVEQENREVVRSLGSSTLEWRQGRRDAFEDVWAMVLAFNEDCERTKCPACGGAGRQAWVRNTDGDHFSFRNWGSCERCGGKGYLEEEKDGRDD